MKNKVLIIDDDENLIDVLSKLLSDDFVISTAKTLKEGLDRYRKVSFDAAVVDIVLPDGNGIDILKEMKNTDSDFPVIVLTGHASIDLAVKAMKLGAFYFAEKPFSVKGLKELLNRAIEHRELRKDVESLQKVARDRYNFSGILGKSKEMQEVFNMIETVAPAEATVLIEGESGTGKELVAKAIHFNSSRKENRFVAINCNALTETLLESELFGYERGAFTGASKKKKGLFEVSEGGTIFLDEIVQTSKTFQSKLLRVLEDGTFYPVGSTEEKKADIRIITATNISMEEAVEESEFREDLFYRLNVVKIVLPPLRKRNIDIPLLTNHFLDLYSKKNKKDIDRVSEETMEILMNYSWPGNVRELENVIERAVIISRNNVILPEHLPKRVVEGEDKEPPEVDDYREAKELFEKKYIRNLLKTAGGKVSRAAQIAGMTRQNIYLKLRKYGINPKIYYRED